MVKTCCLLLEPAELVQNVQVRGQLLRQHTIKKDKQVFVWKKKRKKKRKINAKIKRRRKNA